jgi:hypothetical protein
MKTSIKSKRRSRALLLSILCAVVVATFLGGCTEGPYVTAYDTGYYPTAYYTPSPLQLLQVPVFVLRADL